MCLRRFAPIFSLLVALTGGAAGARAQTVASALNNFDATVRAYNLITLSATATTSLSGYSDTEGGLAIRGNLDLSSAGQIATKYSAGIDPTLYVSGKLDLDGTAHLQSGYAAISNSANGSNYSWSAANKDLSENHGGDLNLSNSGSSQNPLTASGPSNWNWSTIQSNFTADSTALANAKSNGTSVIAGTIKVDGGGNLVLTPNSTPATDATVIFTLDASLLGDGTYNKQTVKNISITVPEDVNYVINVINAGSGTTDLFEDMNFNAGTRDNQLLWNIEGSGTVNIDAGGNFYGSILAPLATINTEAIIDGQVVANAFSDCGSEMHEDAAFTSFASTAVPEPMTFALWGVGLCGAAILVRRKLTVQGGARPPGALGQAK